MSWWWKPKPKPVPTPIPTPTPVPTTKIFGVATDLFSQVADFNAKAGRSVNSYTIYASFYYDPNFPTAIANQVSASGVVPLITWEPWNPDIGVSQTVYSLRSITNGNHDALVKTWAQQIKTYSKPVRISFAPEMNGDWSPWGDGINGNLRSDYVSAYKRIVDLFRNAGVTNVQWVWQPNTGRALTPFYPGDAYVDFVAVDGYNWDMSSPELIFGNTLNQIKAFTSKPIFLGETSCREYSGKPQWITDFFVMLKNHNLVGFVWFNINKENDWRIDSSPSSLAAFKAGINSWI